jgi:hypothetical protein
MAKRKTTKGQEKFEDTKWVIRSLIGGQTTQWLKEIGQTDKQRSKNITQKTKDQATRTPPKTGGCRVNSCAPEGLTVPVPLVTPVVFL